MDKNLEKECLILIGSSLAKNTWHRYATALKKWENFCTNCNTNPKNFNGKNRIKFLCWLNEAKNLKPTTVSMYFSAVKKMFAIIRNFCNTKGHKLEKTIVQGIKNSAIKLREKPCKKITPVNLETLIQLKRWLKRSSYKTLTKKSVWAASLIAFWGCFRLKELLCSKKKIFDKYTDLLWKDIKLCKNHIKIEIKSSKSSGAKSVFVRLGKLTEKTLCPIENLKKLKKTKKEKSFFQKISRFFDVKTVATSLQIF